MTDKQIIIDGIDVSECEYHSLNKNNCSLCSLSNNLICNYKPFCNYKQLKRKEQECEKWKNAYGVKEDALEEAEEYTEELEEKCHKLKQQLDQLKACLTEIKVFSQEVYKLTNRLNRDMALFAKEIIQKINEVEDD